MFIQNWLFFPLHRSEQIHMEIVSCGSANQLQRKSSMLKHDLEPSCILCCCPKTAKEGKSDPLGVDGYIHVSRCPSCLLALISYCFFFQYDQRCFLTRVSDLGKKT